MENIKPTMSKYVVINKKLADLNKQIADLREERRTVENELTTIYAKNEMPVKIELKESHMMFSVKKPGEWKKGWTMSKKDLETYLDEILPEHGQDVMIEILRKHEPKLVSTEYSFDLTSIVKK
jgi:hypothetical protein